MGGSYHDLDIFREAMAIYGDIHQLTQSLPKSETYGLGTQIRRSSDSVVTNIVEG
jgi:four helix bundle protein